MSRLPLLALLLALPACTTIQPYATCANAHRAAEIAARAVDRFCPLEAQ